MTNDTHDDLRTLGLRRGASPIERARQALDAIATSGRPEVWITLRDERDVLADAESVASRLSAGEHLPLAGTVVAVKDNIDVAGVATTAACPEFAYTPARSAPAVRRLVEAGAVVVGKTNLDQFATGLVGTRSPYGAVGAASDPERVAGGSSSGSAVAVALGLVDLALGTDTAGSGRVPAAFNGIIGVKPTRGLVSTSGVVPACPDYDVVSIFARDLATASTALRAVVGTEDGDPRGRRWPADVRLSAPDSPTIGVPEPSSLTPLTRDYRDAFEQTIEQLRASGAEVRTIDVEPLLAAGRLLYEGSLVAQRYASVGSFLATDPPGADPTVASIILGARELRAIRYVDDLDQLAFARTEAARRFRSVDALLLPTAPEHPTIAEVQADPLEVNRRLGTFTTLANLLDLAAVAAPGTPAAGAPFGVTFFTPAFADQVALDLAGRLVGETAPLVVEPGVDLAVFGAHLRGQPLEHQLVELGARFTAPVRTSRDYRLVLLDTSPSKPGLVRVGDGEGAPIEGELWRITSHSLGLLLSRLPEPMSLTPVGLEDGRTVIGFGCSYEAARQGLDITAHGGWRSFLAAR